ncbi:hypothetical protein BJ741DRAFT_637909 [Chytriomyces cf. hyalinus JEL632]|nr:hypothetical protein BJ741DRAFT_637909 [Chytriomyces cf. hyalinus JEL632]
MSILKAVSSTQATENTKMHALYMYHYLNLPATEVARLLHKTPQCVNIWVRRYDRDRTVSRKQREKVYSKHSTERREWLVGYVTANPLSFLDEVGSAYVAKWDSPISLTTVWTIMHDAGLTWKVSEKMFGSALTF